MSAHATLPPAPDLPRIVIDVAAVLAQHRRTHQECSCGQWPLGIDHEEHVAQALQAAGLVQYENRGIAPWFQKLMDQQEDRP